MEIKFMGRLPQANFERTADLLVGIPAINRLDLLERSVRSIDYPADILVVCNSTDFRFVDALWRLAETLPIHVFPQSKNVGVSAGWNTILRYSLRNGYSRTLITAADVRHRRGAIAYAIDKAKSVHPENDFWCLNHFNSFVIEPTAIARVGYFDENFFPAYFEDNDYHYRLRLAGTDRLLFTEDLAEHDGSMTIRSDPAYAAGNSNSFWNWNRNHFICKWGGPPGEEKFATPYGREDVDLKWWPDPFDTLQYRDWDADARKHFGSEITLAHRFARCCREPSDIFEHCATLYSLAARCNHVTELGTGAGVSTCALLFGQPSELVCCNSVRYDVVDELAQIALRTRLVFREEETLQIELNATDFLFIDTRHTFDHLSQELKKHSSLVKRYIAIHDTTVFGDTDEEGRRPGIWPAIEEFVTNHKDWHVSARYVNNNGLTVLERR